MMLGRVASLPRRGGTGTTAACRAAQRRFLSKGGTKDGGKGEATGTIATTAGGLSKSEILAARQARRAEMAGAGNPTGGAGVGVGVVGSGGGRRKLGMISKGMLVTAAGVGAFSVAWHFKADEIRELLDDTFIDHAAVWVTDRIAEVAKPWTDPSSAKLLPDWPLPQIPPDTPCPPLLVLDLEGTLLATVFTRKNGWRSAKRPGLDDFLKEMHQLYEIAVFTDSQGADEWLNKMDPNGYISYRLFRDATKFTGGKHVKDLTSLNRPIEKIVIVDDNPDCFSLQPENGIRVEKFSVEEGSDSHADTVLPDLAPFLRALATQEVTDFREILRPYIGQDSRAVVAGFRSKVAAVRQREAAEKSRGLGGLVRQTGPAAAAAAAAASARRGGMTSKDIVGDAPDTLPPGMANGAMNVGSVPLSEEKRGGFWKGFAEGAKEREEELRRKSEVFQRVMQKREERERAKREEEAKKKGKA